MNKIAPSLTQISKYLCLILRHNPDLIGVTLDSMGYCSVEELIKKTKLPFTAQILENVVDTDNKQRFSYNADKTKIRCVQGHSVTVDYGDIVQVPSVILFHGTVKERLNTIMRQGLRPMSRTHVHLSSETATAKSVGARYGKPIILQIAAKDAWNAGIKFYLADNGVWLADSIPPRFIKVLDKNE